MPTPVLVTDQGTEEAVVRVSCWFVEPGDVVEAGDRIAELMLPGITFDVPSPSAGIVSGIEQSAGAIVHVGDVLGWIAQWKPNETDRETENG